MFDLSSILEFFTDLTHRGADHIAAALVGILIGVGLTVLLGRWIFPSRKKHQLELALVQEENKRLKVEKRDLADKLQTESDKVTEFTEELESKAETLRNLQEELKTQSEELIERIEEIEHLNRQIETITEHDGEIWQRAPQIEVPPFRSSLKGKPPIVAVVNLKGGVGKTTLTANLGAIHFLNQKKTLLVDLDYQGSLTSICFQPTQHHMI